MALIQCNPITSHSLVMVLGACPQWISHTRRRSRGGGGGGRKGKREKGGLGKIGKKEITATRIIAIDFGHESGRKVENVIASLRRACRTLLQISLDYLFDELSHGSLQSHMSFRAKIKNCFF